MKNRKTVLITGASGFIGNFLVDEALKRNFIVYVAVRRTTNIEIFRTKPVLIVEFDFSDTRDLYHKIFCLPQFDYVIHNAGITKSLNKKDFISVNYGYTKRLIFALNCQNKAPLKFIYMSSLAAFGPGKFNSSIPIKQDSEPKPVSLYGKSKLAAEIYIIEKSGLPFIIFRPTAVYGPGDRDFFQAIKLMSKGVDFQIGTHHQNLTFIYVKDLARLIFDAIESICSNRSYFITDGNLYNKHDFGNCVSDSLKRTVWHFAIPIPIVKIITIFIEFVSKISKKNPVLNLEKLPELCADNWNCDIQPLEEDFSFKAEYNLRDGIRETINWYKENGWLK